MSDSLPLLVFISFERKDAPCKTGWESRYSILPLLKNEWHFTPFSVYFIREEERPLLNVGREQVLDFTHVEKMSDTWPLTVFI